MNRLNQELSAPVPHSDHPYWVGGLDAWRMRRNLQGLSSATPLVDAIPDKTDRPLDSLSNRPRRLPALLKEQMCRGAIRMQGVKLHVTPSHSTWLEFRHLPDSLKAAKRDSGSTPIRLVARKSSNLRQLVDKDSGLDFMSFEQSLTKNTVGAMIWQVSSPAIHRP